MCLSAVSKRISPPGGGAMVGSQGQVELERCAGACREPPRPQPEEPAVCAVDGTAGS